MGRSEGAIVPPGARRVTAVFGSAGACEHPTDDDADDVGVVRVPVEMHRLVCTVTPPGAEFDRRPLDSTHMSQHHVSFDSHGNRVPFAEGDSAVLVASSSECDDRSVAHSRELHRLAAHAKAQIGLRPQRLPQRIARDPRWLFGPLTESARLAWRASQLLRLVERHPFAHQRDPALEARVEFDPPLAFEAVQVPPATHGGAPMGEFQLRRDCGIVRFSGELTSQATLCSLPGELPRELLMYDLCSATSASSMCGRGHES